MTAPCMAPSNQSQRSFYQDREVRHSLTAEFIDNVIYNIFNDLINKIELQACAGNKRVTPLS